MKSINDLSLISKTNGTKFEKINKRPWSCIRDSRVHYKLLLACYLSQLFAYCNKVFGADGAYLLCRVAMYLQAL